MSRRDPFLTVRTEGGLLPADLLQRLTERPTQGGASAGPKPLEGLTADAYHLPGEKLSEVISASYAARQKVGGTHLKYHVFKQLPVLPPATYKEPAPWAPEQSLVQWLLPRVLELTYTAWDLQPFARDCGYEGPPYRWDPERRFLLRAELDAAFFHLYGVSRDDAAYILDTFPIVRKNDEKAHGDYRTRRVILERYDALATAARGAPYVTPLDPPPADPRIAHPPRPPAPAPPL